MCLSPTPTLNFTNPKSGGLHFSISLFIQPPSKPLSFTKRGTKSLLRISFPLLPFRTFESVQRVMMSEVKKGARDSSWVEAEPPSSEGVSEEQDA